MEKVEHNKNDYLHLIGKKINGFKFGNDTNGPLSWYASREKYIGKEGSIIDIHGVYPYIKVEFNNVESCGVVRDYVEWWLIEGHEEHLIKDKTEDDLFFDIRKLLIKI